MGTPAALATALFLGGLAALPAHGEDRPFCPDRPGRATPPCVLAAGAVQAELALADVVQDRRSQVRSVDFGDLELRFGVSERTELQLAWSPSVTIRSPGQVSYGYGDLVLAARSSLRHPDGSGLSVAVEPYVSAPTGRRGIGAGAWQGGVLLPVGWQVSDTVALAFTPEIDAAADQDGRGTHLSYAAAAGVSRQAGPVTLGADLWVQRDRDPLGASTQETFDLDAAWQPASLPATQFDLGVNAGLNRATPRLEAYVGLARRF